MTTTNRAATVAEVQARYLRHPAFGSANRGPRLDGGNGGRRSERAPSPAQILARAAAIRAANGRID